MPHSVVFFRTYPAHPPRAQSPDTYQHRKTQARPKGKWLGVSAMTCRDFTKDTYEYRDLHYCLEDQGWRFPVPACLQSLAVPLGTELRKTNLGERKWRNEGKRLQAKMRASSTAMITLSQVEAPVPAAAPHSAQRKPGETEYQRSFPPREKQRH